jgi:hypothetical protein
MTQCLDELNPFYSKKILFEIRGSHSSEDVNVGLLDCNTEYGGSTFLQNIGIYLPTHPPGITTQKIHIDKILFHPLNFGYLKT